MGLAYDSIVSVMSGDLTAGLMISVTCVLSRLFGDQLPCHTLYSEYGKTLTLINNSAASFWPGHKPTDYEKWKSANSNYQVSVMQAYLRGAFKKFCN